MHFYCLSLSYTRAHKSFNFLYALDDNRERCSRILWFYSPFLNIIFLLKILHPLKNLVLQKEKILINVISTLHAAECFLTDFFFFGRVSSAWVFGFPGVFPVPDCTMHYKVFHYMSGQQQFYKGKYKPLLLNYLSFFSRRDLTLEQVSKPLQVVWYEVTLTCFSTLVLRNNTYFFAKTLS